MDNATFHKSKKLKEIIEKAKCRLIYLPPYSPDYNLIENRWNDLKHAIIKMLPKVDNDINKASDIVLKMACNS